MKALHIIMICAVSFLFSGRAYTQTDETKNQIYTDDNYTITKHYDEPSETFYYLTHIRHKDSQGHLNKLRMTHSTVLEGETTRQFAKRVGATLAINASMGIKRESKDDKLLPVGIQIIDGTVVQNLPPRKHRYILGIKANNELVVYPPDTTPETMLEDGASNALTAFIPLIENFKPVDDSVLNLTPAFKAVHPRQIIAQMKNLDIVFLSCGGRGFEGKGMSSTDVIRILQKEGVKFAFMLDGGGSTSTVINGTLINPKIDKQGTKERLRPNFLYFLPQ